MLMNTNAAPKELVPVTARGEATRRKLLASAEHEFGSKGFPAASVSSITQRADVGQGTFYLYFHSKEEVFATLVRELGREQRASLAALVDQSANGRDAERKLAEALVGFIAGQPGRYRILREAQFVDEPVFRETQDQLFTALAGVLHAASRGTLTSEAAGYRAAALVGAAEQTALRQCLWAEKPASRGMIDAIVGH